MKVSVFIDGFNLYYALKGNGLKWLDLGTLADSIVRKDEHVDRIHYFTARVDGVGDTNRPRRQQVYLNAISVDSRVQIYQGSFLTKPITRPVERLLAPDTQLLTTLPPTTLNRGEHELLSSGKRKSLMVLGNNDSISAAPTHQPVYARVHTREEKGSDVNLASHLIHRAWKNEYDKALIISNDSDLCEPIRIVQAELGKEVTVCHVKQGRQGVSKKLKMVATGIYHVSTSQLRHSQFPDHVADSSGRTISKPSKW